MKNIAFYIAHYSLANSASILNLLDLLSKNAKVYLFLLDVALKENPLLLSENVLVLDLNELSLESPRHELSPLTTSIDVHIAFDPHGFLLCKILFPECHPIYYSLELYLKNDHFGLYYPDEVSFAERATINSIQGLIIQSREKELLFRKDYQLPETVPAFLLPVTCRRNKNARKSDLIHRKYHLLDTTKIALHLGGIASWFSCIELAITFGTIDNWVLLFQGYADEKYTQELLQTISSMGIKNVIVSNEIFENILDVDQIIAACDIGIAWYNDISEGFRTAGFSSGKIASYMQFGLPVIAKRYESTFRAIEEPGAGLCVNEIHQIPAAINIINSNYLHYSTNAQNTFEKIFCFDNYIPSILSFIHDHKTCNAPTALAPQDYWDSNYNTLKLVKAPSEDPVRNWIEKYIPRGDGTCLEVGAFPGRYLAVFGELGYELHGIDLTPRVETDLPVWLKNNGFQTGTFERCNFLEYGCEKQHDIVCSFGFIEHFTNWETVLIKHTPLVKDGGLLVVEAPNFSGKLQKHLHSILDKKNMQRHCLEAMCPDRWVEILTVSGFEIIFSGYFGGFDFWIDSEELEPALHDVIAGIRKITPVLKTIQEDDPSYSPYCGLIARKKVRSTDISNVVPYPLYPEVDKWALSDFITNKLLPVVGAHPFPLDEQLLMAGAVSFFRPDVIIEWGTNIGKSARIFHELRVHLGLDTPIHSIDLPPEAVHPENIKDLQSRGALVTGLPVFLHLGDGLAVAEQLIKEGGYQRPLIFVDGDHAYTSVMRELEGIRNIAGEAVILAHDTFLQSQESGYNCGPGEAVLEFTKRHNLETWSTNLGLPGMSLIHMTNTKTTRTCSLANKHVPKSSTSKSRLSILLTVEFYYPHIGGSETVVQQLSERLTRRGHKVTVATTRLAERDFSELNGVTIREFDLSGNLATGLHGADAQAYLDFLNTSQFDVVMNYACQQWATDIALLHITQNRHPQTAYIVAPCGYSALDETLEKSWPSYSEYFSSIIPHALPQYDAAIYHSVQYKDYRYAQKHGFTNNHVIPNGVGEDEFETSVTEDFRQLFGITTRFMGLCVANYYPAKGHVRLIDCVRTMNRTDFTLVCIGKEGDHLPYLQKQAEGLPIKFVLDIPRNLTVAAYHAADIFLFGSEVEASPLVIIEAKASRTPFVSTNCGNVSEWKGGIVCAPEDMARIANHLLNNEQLRQQLVDEGWQEWKATQTWEAIVDQYERLYLGLVQHKNRGVNA